MTTKRPSPLPKILLIVALAAVLAVGGAFGWCSFNSAQARKAAEANDFDAAHAYCAKDFLSGSKTALEIKQAEGNYYMDQRIYAKAIEIFREVGPQDRLLEAQQLYGKKLMADRKYEAAMELFASMGDQGKAQWEEAAVGHARNLINQGKFEEVEALLGQIANLEAAGDIVSKLNVRKFMALNQEFYDIWSSGNYMDIIEFEGYPQMKQLMASITDREFLTDWEYSFFVEQYAADCILEKNFETAIEFFGYSDSEYDRPYADVLRCLLDQDFAGALAILESMEYTNLSYTLDMSWPQIFAHVSGLEKDENDLNSLLTFQSIHMLINQADSHNYAEWAYGFVGGEHMGPVEKNQYTFPVEDLDALYAQCGSDPKGKVLILRAQKNYPQDGKTNYAVELGMMDDLDKDLYPMNLSEVQYILMLDYDFFNAGNYVRTLSFGDNKTTDTFAFLRIKGRVVLTELGQKKAIYTSPWANGEGEPDVWGAEVYQTSKAPDLTQPLITAVEKISQ